MKLNHLIYFSEWNRRDNDDKIQKYIEYIQQHFALDLSIYRLEEVSANAE